MEWRTGSSRALPDQRMFSSQGVSSTGHNENMDDATEQRRLPMSTTTYKHLFGRCDQVRRPMGPSVEVGTPQRPHRVQFGPPTLPQQDTKRRGTHVDMHFDGCVDDHWTQEGCTNVGNCSELSSKKAPSFILNPGGEPDGYEIFRKIAYVLIPSIYLKE